jgi:hypothetical protein
MSTKHYAKVEEALEAGKAAYGSKYGVHPKFYVYQRPKGYKYSKTDRLSQCNVRIVEEIPNYFREALRALIGEYPPMDVPPYGAQLMGDKVVELQDWCSDNANPPWATGLSMIEAAELIVDQALENANIKKT